MPRATEWREHAPAALERDGEVCGRFHVFHRRNRYSKESRNPELTPSPVDTVQTVLHGSFRTLGA